MNSEIIQQRVRAMRPELKKLKLDAMVFTGKANVSYVTGFMGEDSLAIVSGRGCYLLTDSRYSEQAEAECPKSKIVQRKGSLVAETAKVVNRQKSIRTLGVENTTSVESYGNLKKAVNARIKAVGGIVEPIRAIKQDAEVKLIRQAAKIAAKALENTLLGLRAGISENELAGLVDYHIRKLGAAASFETIVAFGANASRPHHRPSQRRLRKDDTILIDFGAAFEGYCCDITRCFGFGRTTQKYRRIYEVVKQAQAAAIDLAAEGVKMSELDRAARQVIREHNLPVFGHGTGHGLGLEVHEMPRISGKSDEKLKVGMVFTIEPGVYIPGQAGVRIEDDILITQNGCEILTKCCNVDGWL